METIAKKRNATKKKLSKEEFRAMLPQRLNKFGEWLVANKDAWDYGDGKIVLR